jgi:galactokinase
MLRSMGLPEIRRAIAPGRVTLVGDHTDYAGGRSLAMAIGLATTATFEPSERTSVIVETAGVVPRFEIGGVQNTPASFTERVIAELIHELDRGNAEAGGTLRIASDLPIGAGLSSSASFVVASALALGATVRGRPLALLAQRVEQHAGANVGLLDQITICESLAGYGLVIDFTSLETSPVRLPEQAAWSVVDSGIPRRLVDAPYAERRRECEEAQALVGPLAFCSLDDVEAIADPVLRARARHVVSETARVDATASALSDDDLARAGALMNESHDSLANDFEVSTPEIDVMAEDLRARPGIFGARISGAGFGGCLVVLHDPEVDVAVPGRRSWRVHPSAAASLR